jgi:CBS domain-containing protein
MQVKELMTRAVVCCRDTDKLTTAAMIMWDCDVGTVPVLDGDGRVVGMITDRDIAMAAYTRGQPLTEIPVASARSQTLIACTPEDDIAAVEEKMRSSQVRRVPVLDALDELVGILSLNDLVRAASATRRFGAPAPAEVTATLGAICRPRDSAQPASAS